MTRAEEKALEIFPVKKVPYYGLTCNAYSERDANLDKRALFCMGYEQAEKDLALTWEDIDEIIGFFEDMKEQIIALKLDDETLCKEVLKRFNEQRNGR